MGLVIVLFVALFTISNSNSSFVHPSGIALLTGQTEADLDCRQPVSPNLSLESERPSRAASFGMIGKYECRRPIFSFDERDPFIERLLQIQSANAKRVATEVDARLRGDARLVHLDVEGIAGGLDDEKLLDAVATIYRNELNQALGRGRVARLPAESAEAVKAGNLVLVIHVRRVDDAELMVQARLTTGAAKRTGELEWLEL